jgi:hypothetical protein
VLVCICLVNENVWKKKNRERRKDKTILKCRMFCWLDNDVSDSGGGIWAHLGRCRSVHSLRDNIEPGAVNGIVPQWLTVQILQQRFRIKKKPVLVVALTFQIRTGTYVRLFVLRIEWVYFSLTCKQNCVKTIFCDLPMHHFIFLIIIKITSILNLAEIGRISRKIYSKFILRVDS